MEFRQLEYLVAVVDDGSFTRAAERLHVTQPGVSTQIRRLERELGQALLDRSGRSVRPTAAGTAVLEHARTALGAVANVRRVADELSGLVRGSLALAAAGLPVSVDVPGTLAGFRKRHPGVDVTLSVADPGSLLAGLRSGRFDAAFDGMWPDPPAGLAAHVLSDRPIVAVTAADDPLAGRGRVTLAELAGRDVICLPPGTGHRDAVDAAFARHGLRPRITFEASNPQVLASLAGHGLGVALVPESIAHAEPGPVHVLEIAGTPPLRTRFGLLWRAGGPLGPAADAFVRHVRASPPARADPPVRGPGVSARG